MRHSRKAVMKEHYKLYMKKHILNGRYFVRNMQIAAGLVLVMALVIGAAFAGYTDKDETVTASAKVSMKDALFGSSEEVQTAKRTENVQAASSELDEISTEAVTAAKIVDVAVNENMEKAEQAASYNEEEEAAKAQEEKDEQSKFSDRCIANVEATLNIRKQPDAESEFVGSMNPGAIAKVVGTEGEWTKIKSGDVEGYVLTEYVLTGEAAEKFSENYVTLQGSVLEDGVNVRKEASTEADILQVLNKDDTVSVAELPEDEEEAQKEKTSSVAKTSANQKKDSKESKTEDINWVTVVLDDGQTGYVSADLVEVDELYELAVSADELQRIAEEKEAAKRAAEEEAARQAMAANTNQSSGGSNNGGQTTSTDDDSSSYQGATTTPVTATESGDCIGTFTITAYCGCKKCSGGNNKTATGTTPTEGRTIAADTSILPYGTQVVIDGIVYTVEDCGSGVRGNHIDIFFATHEKALAFGKKSVKVYKY